MEIILRAFYILICSPIIIALLVHELGHAIVGLLLYRKKAEVFIGSYGDPNGFAVNLGIMKLYFSKDFYSWNHGLCNIPKVDNFYILRGIAYAAAGPIASLFGLIFSLYVADHYRQIGIPFFICLLPVLAFFNDFYNTLFRSQKVILHDGTFCFSDGETLRRLFMHGPALKQAFYLSKYIERNEFDAAWNYFYSIHKKTQHHFVLAFQLARITRDENLASEIIEQWEREVKPNDFDYEHWSVYYADQGQYEKAISLLDKLLKLDPRSAFGHNNKGYYLIMLHRYEEAIKHFDLVVNDATQTKAYSLNNKGYALIKLARLEEALLNLQASEALLPDNGYLWRNYGLYFVATDDLVKAREYYQKAIGLDDRIVGIEELQGLLDGRR